MPKKSRRSRRARGGQTAPRGPSAPVAVRESGLPSSARVGQATAGRPAQSGPDLAQQFRHLRSDVRRIFSVAGVCLAVLIGVYFLLR